MNEKLQAEKALIKTIADAGASELMVNSGEKLIDSITDNQALREIPLIKTLIGITKAGIGISDYLFTKKVIKFIQGSKFSDKAREKFLRRIKRDKKFEAKVGETLFLLLEKLDDMDKPELIGLFFSEFLEGKLSFVDFVRLSKAMERVFLPDLAEFKKIADVNGVDYEEDHFFSTDAEVSLLHAGLIRIYTAGDTPDVLISPVGDLMVKYSMESQRLKECWAIGWRITTHIYD